ncbi:MAG: MBL fold metallo-hydrolase, partial [Acidimicrobiia bacterium]|nr:MBL fold metallo-hydrolase [Acidimicrobiia bacterium]
MSEVAAHADRAGIDHYCWPQHGIERQAADARPTLHYRDTQMEIHKVVVGPFDNNVFIVRCRQSGDAVLIDAANEHELLVDLCGQLVVHTVLETHGHHDHIGSVPEMRDAGYNVHI